MTDWTENVVEFRTILTIVPIADEDEDAVLDPLDPLEPAPDIGNLVTDALRRNEARMWDALTRPPGAPAYDEQGRRIVGRGRGRPVMRPALPPGEAPAGD